MRGAGSVGPREGSRLPPWALVCPAALAALAGTRGTINAAGLAASFALLVRILLQDFSQVGVAGVPGILLDAFVIRTLLVSPLVLLVGRADFWLAKART